MPNEVPIIRDTRPEVWSVRHEAEEGQWCFSTPDWTFLPGFGPNNGLHPFVFFSWRLSPADKSCDVGDWHTGWKGLDSLSWLGQITKNLDYIQFVKRQLVRPNWSFSLLGLGLKEKNGWLDPHDPEEGGGGVNFLQYYRKQGPMQHSPWPQAYTHPGE